MTNCKNCGAPLHGIECEYCGTSYSQHRRFFFNPAAFEPQTIERARPGDFIAVRPSFWQAVTDGLLATGAEICGR